MTEYATLVAELRERLDPASFMWLTASDPAACPGCEEPCGQCDPEDATL